MASICLGLNVLLAICVGPPAIAHKIAIMTERALFIFVVISLNNLLNKQ